MAQNGSNQEVPPPDKNYGAPAQGAPMKIYNSKSPNLESSSMAAGAPPRADTAPAEPQATASTAGDTVAPPDGGDIVSKLTDVITREVNSSLKKFKKKERRKRRKRRKSSKDSSSSDSSSSSSEEENKNKNNVKFSAQSGTKNNINISNTPITAENSSGNMSVDSNIPIADWNKFGSSVPGLTEIQPSNPRFRSVVSYRRYRLKKTDATQGRKVLRDTGVNTRRLLSAMQQDTFDGTDPLKIMHLLLTFKDRCDKNNLSEGAALLILPDIFKGLAKDSLANRMTQGAGLPTYPHAVQYLLLRYVKSD